MTLLQAELHRLYFPRSSAPGGGTLLEAPDRVRCLVMEMTRPPSWKVLSLVWQGVQAELELPAPATAVSGTDALQLWFSLAEPIPAARAHAFLDRLRLRFLPDIEPSRIRLLPAADASVEHPERHARPVPALQADGNWSAFLAQDLAPVFADTPWLDIAPGEEGQAALLRGLEAIAPAAFEIAWTRVLPAATAGPLSALEVVGPRQFLQRVMNDESVALALRVEAAKALLACDLK